MENRSNLATLKVELLLLKIITLQLFVVSTLSYISSVQATVHQSAREHMSRMLKAARQSNLHPRHWVTVSVTPTSHCDFVCLPVHQWMQEYVHAAVGEQSAFIKQMRSNPSNYYTIKYSLLPFLSLHYLYPFDQSKMRARLFSWPLIHLPAVLV